MRALPSQGRRCGCEHESHLIAGSGAHGYLEVPAGSRSVWFVGPVCDECADGHCKEYVRHVVEGASA